MSKASVGTTCSQEDASVLLLHCDRPALGHQQAIVAHPVTLQIGAISIVSQVVRAPDHYQSASDL